MSVASSKLVISEVVGVNSAVQHLMDLKHRMKDHGFTYKDDDLQSIDGIIESLRELQLERNKVHDNLEVETIKASILRHQLWDLPGKIRAEISAAVIAARDSNLAELTRLQNNLDSIKTNIELLEAKYRKLEEDNAIAHPRRDQIRQGHEQIIVQLNQILSEKASKQIFLNETRDKLRTTNQKIVDIEDNILQLKEDLVQERSDARMEKRQLKKAVYDTSRKTREQKEANVEKKKEVDELNELLLASEKELDNIRYLLRRNQAARQRMENQEKGLIDDLTSELHENINLKTKGEFIAKEASKDGAMWEKKKAMLENTLKDLNAKLITEQERKTVVSQEYKKVASELAEKLKLQKADEQRNREVNTRLQALKTEQAAKAGRIGELSLENTSLEEAIELAIVQHKSTMITLRKQLEEATALLSKERKAMAELEENRDVIDKETVAVKKEAGDLLSDNNMRIQLAKKQQELLTEKELFLKARLTDMEARSSKFKSDMISTKADYVRTASEYELQLVQMKESIEETNARYEDINKDFMEKEPEFVKLEDEFDEHEEAYAQIKADFIAQKNKKIGLEDLIQRNKMQLEKLLKSLPEYEEENQRVQLLVIKQLEKHSMEVLDLETDVYALGCKLKTIIEENDNFITSNSKLEKDIANMRIEIIRNVKLGSTLKEQISELRALLTVDWKEDELIQEKFATKDRVLVDLLSLLITSTASRKDIVATISEKLKDEVTLLGEFIEKVATHRPSDEADVKRRSLAHDPVAAVAGANSPPPTPINLRGSPQPHIYPIIPPILSSHSAPILTTSEDITSGAEMTPADDTQR